MKSPSHFLPVLNVRAKILLIFLALSMASLLIVGFVAFATISDIGHSARASSTALGTEAILKSTTALEAAAADDLNRTASDQAQLMDEIFWESEMELNLLGSQALSLQNNPAFVSQIPSYPASAPPANPLDGTVVLLAPGVTISPDSEEYRALAGMDDLIAAVYRSDGNLTSVYVASASGIMRSYPGIAVSDPSFDPRKRPWFTAAMASENPVWTTPYVDASNGHTLIITCAKKVNTRYGPWVIASDTTNDQLNDFASQTLGGKGYPVIIDQDGTIISSPNLSLRNVGLSGSIPEKNIFSSSSPGLVAIAHNMTSGKTGIARTVVDGNDIIIAYAPVSSQNWSYSVSMLASTIGEPIRETTINISLATQGTSEDILRQTDRLLYIFAGLFILLLVIVIILSWLLARMITRPVDALREGTAVIGSGNLDFRLTINSGDEFEALADSFNRMATDLKCNIENLRRTTAEKERYSREMEIAKEIQGSFLPENVPVIPGFDVAAATLPAMEIGGDLYDFIPVAGNRWGFAIADVSGKGVSAALYMALCRTLLHASGEADPDPTRAVQTANRLIYEDGRSIMFITVFYGVLQPEAMTFSYVNAGHNPPLLLRRGEPGSWISGVKGIALGVVPDVSIAATRLELRHGDILVLYTDGVTEAFNEHDQDFGEERLLDSITRNQARPAQEILDALIDEVKIFAGTAPQSDDITLVVIRVL